MTLDEEVPLTVDAMLSESCMAAATASTLSEVKTLIFERNCGGGSCHRDDSTQSDLHLIGNPHTALVGVTSTVDNRYQLVVPGQPNQSYLLYMIRAVAAGDMQPEATATPPGEVPFMPQGSDDSLCVQKLDAVRRWIEAGALDN